MTTQSHGKLCPHAHRSYAVGQGMSRLIKYIMKMKATLEGGLILWFDDMFRSGFFRWQFHALLCCLAKFAVLFSTGCSRAIIPPLPKKDLCAYPGKVILSCHSSLGIGATPFPLSGEHIPSGIMKILNISLGGGGCLQCFNWRTGEGLFLPPWDSRSEILGHNFIFGIRPNFIDLLSVAVPSRIV